MTTLNVCPEAKAQLEEGLRLSRDPATVEQAAAAFERAIVLCPGYALAYFSLGTMYFTWSHFQKAIPALQKAIQLEPDDPASHYNLGAAYNGAGLYRDAEKALKDFLQLRPDHAQAFYELGFATLMQFGKENEAISHFREAVRLDPHHAKAYQFLGIGARPKRGFRCSA